MVGKDSFILYTKYIHIFKALSLEQRGALITHIFEYVNDNISETEEDNIQDVTVKIAWLAVKTDLKEDLVKWKDTCKKRSEAGKMGGRPKKEENQTKAKKANANFAKNKKAKKADSECEYDCDNEYELNKVSKDTMSEQVPDIVDEVISFLNQKAGTRYRKCAATTKFIKARVNEGRTLEDFKYVITNKCAAWKNTDMEKYLRPETLFNATKFESYLNEPEVRTLKENPIYDKNGGFEEI